MANTLNEYFYKPAYGAYGTTELALYDAALDATDLIIKANVDAIASLVIGTDVQAYDATLTSIALLGTAADKIAYTTGVDTWAETALTAFGRSILDDANEATFKATVNLEIGTDVQAYDLYLTAIAALAKTDSSLIVGNGTTWVLETGNTLRTSLGLAIGTDVQAYDASLSSIAALTYAEGSFIALTAEDTYTVRTYAQTLTDIGGAASGANTDITSLSAITGAIATATNISMTGELDITGALGCIDLNPAFQTTKNIIDITPTATLNATQIWKGVFIDGSALDPNGVDVEICGYKVDFSGVSETNSPAIHGFISNVLFGQDAFHIMEGQLHIDTVLPATAASEFTTLDIVVDSSALVSTSEYHAIDVATTGTPAGNVVALGTHFGIDVIHQHISTFATPSQTEFAGVKHTGGTVWVDGIDAYGVIFAAVSDAIYVGGAAQFDEIEVVMTTGGTKTIQPTFWYNTAADTWTQFFPADDTDGFQQSGEIRWGVDSITATWTGNGDPGGAETTAGYWIKIVRTRVGTVGSPDPATVKIGLATKYSWDKDGDITAKSLALTTPLGAAYGGTGVANNAASTLTITGAYATTLTVEGTTALTLPTAGRVLSDPITSKTGTATMTVAEAGTVLVSAAGAAYTITLPTAVGHAGLTYHFVKTDANYTLITLDGDGTETINYENSTGTPNLTYARLNTYCAEVTVVSDGSNWQVIDEAMGQVPECRVYSSITQNVIPDNTMIIYGCDLENYDIGDNFDLSEWVSGNADGTVADHLQDDGNAQFTSAMVGYRVKNTTDSTYAWIITYNDTGDVTLSANIFVDTEGYEIIQSKFVAPVAGDYTLYLNFQWKLTITAKRYGCRYRHNGNWKQLNFWHSALAAGDLNVLLQDTIVLAKDDYLEFAAIQSSGTTTPYLQLGENNPIIIRLISKD